MPYLSKRMQIKRAYLSSFCSTQVVNTVLFNQDWSAGEKMRILEKAKKIAKKKGRSRVFVEDWEQAIK